MRRSRLDRATAWAPVVLLGGLAALTFWLDAQVQRGPRAADGSTRHDPDMVVSGLSAVNLGPDGHVLQELSALRGRHFPDDQTMELDQLTIVATEPGRPRLEITADRGKLSADREHAYFYGNVKAEREAAGADQPVQGPLTLTTEYLHVIWKTQRVLTDRPVTITEPRAIIRGTGLEYDHESRTFRLLSNVSGQFTPPKK